MKKVLKLLLRALIGLFFIGAFAQYASVTSYDSNYKKRVPKVNFTDWATLLRKNTSVLGTIDYSGFKKDKDIFERFIKEMSTTKITNKWTQSERKAYWINTYNAFSVKLITDNFPLKNINEISKPFKQKFFEINGTMMSLKDIEDILKEFEDPRVLLVLNRNSISGVRLIKRAYNANELDELLDKRIRLFINNKEKNQITESRIRLSPIFKIYEKEIKKYNGSLKKFLNSYSDIVIEKQKISYNEFKKRINSYQAYGE